MSVALLSVHLSKTLCNVRGSFSWSFDRNNLCRPCDEGLFKTHADSFYFLNSIFSKSMNAIINSSLWRFVFWREKFVCRPFG